MLNGTSVPKILLKTSTTTTHTIDFGDLTPSGYSIYNLQMYFQDGLDVRWDPEYDTDQVRMANSGRTLKNYLAGFRFRLEMNFNDLFLKAANYADYGELEYYMGLIDSWLLTPGRTIVVYPYRNNANIYYTCIVESSWRGNLIRGVPLTIASQYQMTLAAIGIVTSKPIPSPLPWEGM